jgi:hypothetical protein
LVDGQIVPRLRETLTARGLEIPNNRVVVVYRPPDRVVQARFLQLRRQARRLLGRREPPAAKSAAT